jgi:YggT family protein
MLELLWFISYVLQLYVYVLIAAAVLSWLIAFNVVNMRNQRRGPRAVLYAVTEPVLG